MTGYRTVERESRIELVERKSRFIGWCFPIASEEEALAHLSSIRKQHHDASHNCWAYRLTPNGSVARYSDDGEPGGTAGMPILNAITGRELTDVLVIVTRYFGGILLGAGGLTRTYGKSAGMALEEAGLIQMLPGVALTIVVSYAMYGKIGALLAHPGLRVQDTRFEADVSIEGTLRLEEYPGFERDLADATDGTAQLTRGKELLFPF